MDLQFKLSADLLENISTHISLRRIEVPIYLRLPTINRTQRQMG